MLPSEAPMIHTPTLALLPRRAPWLFLFLLLPVLAAQQELTRLPDGVLLKQPAGLLQIQMRADNIVRVAFAKDPGFFIAPSSTWSQPPAPRRIGS